MVAAPTATKSCWAAIAREGAGLPTAEAEAEAEAAKQKEEAARQAEKEAAAALKAASEATAVSAEKKKPVLVMPSEDISQQRHALIGAVKKVRRCCECTKPLPADAAADARLCSSCDMLASKKPAAYVPPSRRSTTASSSSGTQQQPSGRYVPPSRRGTTAASSSRKLKLINIPEDSNEDDVRQLLARYRLARVAVPKDHYSQQGMSRGVAYVTFHDAMDAAAVLASSRETPLVMDYMVLTVEEEEEQEWAPSNYCPW